MWFTKSRRAQNDQDYETWIVGGVSPTLNAFDNAHETRATVIIDFTHDSEVRVYDTVSPTLQARMGTGGNQVPHVAQETTHDVIGTLQARSYKEPNHENARDGQLVINNAIPIQDGREMDKKQNGLGIGNEGDPSYTLDQTGAQGVEHMMQVRRLTPIECERLMGWPDNHTETGTNGPISDTNRYKMCGNGVASPVAQWIGQAILGCHPNGE